MIKRNLDLKAEELFDKLVNRCDIICHGDKSDTISFKHKTFSEYFYALKLFKAQTVQQTEDVFDIYWMNIYFFLFGLKRDCPELLEELVNIKTTTEMTKILRMINLGNFLLAAYSTPYDIIITGIKSVFVNAVEYYYDIITNKIESPFINIPEMHLLSLFRTILRGSYSYNFFKNAIETVLIEAEELEIDDKRKALLLFLLDIAYVETGGISIFDSLIDKFGPKLPLPIQLAIYHESEFLKDKTKTIHRMEKRLRRALKGNRSLASAIDNLYNRPIGTLSIT